MSSLKSQICRKNSHLPNIGQSQQRIALLRLSAIGDCIHVLPLVHAMAKQLPQAQISWIINCDEQRLFAPLTTLLKNLEFIVVDKKQPRQNRKILAQYQFDTLLHLQTSLRASLLSRHIKAAQKIGFDKARSKELQQFFINQKISGEPRVHFTDTFLQFLPAIGLNIPQKLSWQLPIETTIDNFKLPGKYFLLAPCSSSANKDWQLDNYLPIIDFLQQKYNLPIVICTAPQPREINAAAYLNAKAGKLAPVINLAGKTSLKQLFTLIKNACCLLCPDSGPAHIATVSSTPVVSLFAITNPLQTGPYNSLDLCVNAYPQALQKYAKTSVAQAAWGKRVKNRQALKLITVDAVIHKLELALAKQT